MQVVERIRRGDGKEKTLLVIDSETEEEMTKRVSQPASILLTACTMIA
jgi:hypothetical protein